MKYVAQNQVAQTLWLVVRTAFEVKYFVCFWCDRPPVGPRVLIHEVSRSHSTTNNSR